MILVGLARQDVVSWRTPNTCLMAGAGRGRHFNFYEIRDNLLVAVAALVLLLWVLPSVLTEHPRIPKRRTVGQASGVSWGVVLRGR